MYSLALEAIETVNVVTNSPDAEQGIAGGAAVKLTTESVYGNRFQHNIEYYWVYPICRLRRARTQVEEHAEMARRFRVRSSYHGTLRNLSHKQSLGGLVLSM
jgi:hypothetical protein